MTPAERVAERTWTTLKRASQLRVRFGEATLTDLLVLDMLPHEGIRGFWLCPTTTPAEGRCGADLLVAVRHQAQLWSCFALQAKKLYPDDRYRMLNRVAESKRQLERLESFAQQFHALPLYLLYNHCSTANREDHWHCSRRFSRAQLGCTVVPICHVRRMLCRGRRRDFDRAHRNRQSRPWRCVFDCPCWNAMLQQMAVRKCAWSFSPTLAPWLEELYSASERQLTINDVDRFRSEVMAPSVVGSGQMLYPTRLLLFDRSEVREAL